jgi:starch phosphorylase
MFSVNVVPCLPPALKPLRELAFNLWWTWHPDALDLFRRLDQDAWKASRNNPEHAGIGEPGPPRERSG